MLTRTDMATRILVARILLELHQSHSEDVYDRSLALRSAIIMALQREGMSRLGLQLADKHVPRGGNITPFSSGVIAALENALFDDAEPLSLAARILDAEL